MPRACIFDLDGVITDTAELHYQAWQKLADVHGLEFDRDSNESIKGVSRSESLNVMLAGKKVDTDSFNKMLEQKNQDYVESLQHLGPQNILPGSAEFLAQLQKKSVPIAIASASKNAKSILYRLGLATDFDAISDGHSVHNSKPAPDVFVHAAGGLGQACEDCIVFEDAAAGVRGAQIAGMMVVGVGLHLESLNPDLLVESTADLNLSLIVSKLGLDYGSN